MSCFIFLRPFAQFMASAGYDPRAALDLWDLMAAVEADAAAQGRPVSIEDRLSFLQTHPTSQVRQEVGHVQREGSRCRVVCIS